MVLRPFWNSALLQPESLSPAMSDPHSCNFLSRCLDKRYHQSHPRKGSQLLVRSEGYGIGQTKRKDVLGSPNWIFSMPLLMEMSRMGDPTTFFLFENNQNHLFHLLKLSFVSCAQELPMLQLCALPLTLAWVPILRGEILWIR